MEVINLFPTAVGRQTLRELTDDERAVLEELGAEKKPNEGNRTSAKRTILHDPRLADLKALVLEHLQAYADGVIIPVTAPKVAITQSWLNFNEKGQWHHRHAHPCSWLSACLYVSANKDTDRIYFHRSGYDRLVFEARDFNPWNSPSWWLPVGPMDLVIFPSYLEHHVAPNEADGHVRISLAINTWFNGEAGSVDSLTGLACEVGGPYAG